MSKYTDDLSAAFEVDNPIEIAERYTCPLLTFHATHAHALGHNDHRAEIIYLRDGEWRRRTFRAHAGGPRKESRQANISKAQAWAARNLDVTDWAPTGFPDAWIPTEARTRLRAELAAWRKQGR